MINFENLLSKTPEEIERELNHYDCYEIVGCKKDDPFLDIAKAYTLAFASMDLKRNEFKQKVDAIERVLREKYKECYTQEYSNNMWNLLRDKGTIPLPRIAIISEKFYITNGKWNSPWNVFNFVDGETQYSDRQKVHISIQRDDANFKKAFDIIVPILAKWGVKCFKITTVHWLENRRGENDDGKEFVIYMQTKQEGQEKNPEFWVNLLNEIETALVKEEVKKGNPSQGDCLVEGSHGFCYFRESHDVLDRYVRADLLLDGGFTAKEAAKLYSSEPHPLEGKTLNSQLPAGGHSSARSNEKGIQIPSASLSAQEQVQIKFDRNQSLNVRRWLAHNICLDPLCEAYERAIVKIHTRLQPLGVNLPIGSTTPALYHHFVVPFVRKVKEGSISGEDLAKRPIAEICDEKTLLREMIKCGLRDPQKNQIASPYPQYVLGMSNSNVEELLDFALGEQKNAPEKRDGQEGHQAKAFIPNINALKQHAPAEMNPMTAPFWTLVTEYLYKYGGDPKNIKVAGGVLTNNRPEHHAPSHADRIHKRVQHRTHGASIEKQTVKTDHAEALADYMNELNGIKEGSVFHAEPELYAGIGVAFYRNEDNQIVLDKIFQGKGAPCAGKLNEGDIITHIDGELVENKSEEQISKLIRGVVGTTVKIQTSLGETHEIRRDLINGNEKKVTTFEELYPAPLERHL